MAVVAFERVPTSAPGRAMTPPLTGPNPAPAGEARLTDTVLAVADELRIQDKELAYFLGYTERYISKIRHGEKKLHFDCLAQLPPAFRRALWRRLATADGLRVVTGDGKRRAIGQLLVAIGAAVEELDEQRELPLRPAKAQLG